MCLAKAYVRSGALASEASSGVDAGERLIMENVVRVDISGDTLTLRSLFGGVEAVPGRIASIDFTDSRLIVQSVEG
jgi:predicted RNA-binding protein